MAKRISDLTEQNGIGVTWVLAIEDNAGSISETEKIKVSDLKDTLGLVQNNWTTATLLNSWAGTAKYRLDHEGYLELFLDVNNASATDTLVFSLPVDSRIDYNYNTPVGTTVSNAYLGIASSGQVSITNTWNAPIYVRLPQTQP